MLLSFSLAGAYTAADWEATTRSQAEFHSAQLLQGAALARARLDASNASSSNTRRFASGSSASGAGIGIGS